MKSRMLLPIVVTLLGVCALGGTVLWILSLDRDESTTVAGLIQHLKTDVSTQRRDAAAALGHVVGPGASDAATALIAALKDSDTLVRTQAAQSLGTLVEINPTRLLKGLAISALEFGLRDPNPKVRASAMISLKSLGEPADGMSEPGADRGRTETPVVQIEPQLGLPSQTIRDAYDLRRLIGRLNDPDLAIQQTARTLLIGRDLSLTPEMALNVLATALRTESPVIREVVATMLGRLIPKVPPSRDLLRLALRDETPSVRLAAAAALGAFSEDGMARSALRVATDDPDLRVRATASASLALGRRSTRAEAFTNPWVALINGRGRHTILDEIETDPDHAVLRLLNALNDRSPRIRAAAASCLGEVMPHSALVRPTIEALILALTDRAPAVRQASATALARYGPAAGFAADALKRAVHDEDRKVSGQAFVTLRGLGATQVR